jgi:Ca2+-binding RTX toxin-like protein
MVRAMSTSLRVLASSAALVVVGLVPAAAADEPVVLCDGKPATMLGTPGDDKIIGDASDDVIVGFGGNDTLVGAEGNDTICGFDGDDTIIGGPGDDVLLGGRGSDWVDYRSAHRRNLIIDLAAGTATGHGIDTLASIENVEGNSHHNEIYGNGAANTLRADGGKDILWGRGGDDVIEAGHKYTELRGGPGDDHLRDEPWVDEAPRGNVHGGAGNDTFEIGHGGVVTGGPGDDSITIVADWSIVHPGGGDDTVEALGSPGRMPRALVSYWHAPGPVEVDLATGIATGWGTDQLIGVSDVNGTRYNDVMRGAPPYGGFRGYGGNDILEAAATGGEAGATLHGGRGDDVLRGSGGDDFLAGDRGSDILFGLEGDDRLVGGEGRDELDGGEGRDVISFYDLDGPMVVNLSTQKVFGPGADAFVNIEGATGSRGDDDMTGTPDDDYLNGHLGNDTIRGRSGDDDIRGWGGDDMIYAGFGDDEVAGDAGADRGYGGAGFDTLRGGPGDDALFGGSGNDELLGGTDSNALDGGADFDTCKQAATYISCELIL